MARGCLAARLGALVLLMLAPAPASVRAAELEGVGGALAWRIADIRQGPTTVDGAAHARHEFTLVLKNTGNRPLVLRGYTAQMSYAGIAGMESAAPLDTTLPAGGEFRLLLYALLPCAGPSTPCRFVVGPGWRIVLSGRDRSGTEFTTPIDVVLPVEAGRPVVSPPKLGIARAAAPTGPAAGPVPARFTSNVVLVRVSAGGEELWLLFDTGAQLSILRPEAARRAGVSVPADAPLYPTMGFGGRLNAAVVEWPPLRIGDYVIEHLVGGIAELPEFPVPIDGVLGANFIEAFRVTIDHRAKELRLEPTR